MSTNILKEYVKLYKNYKQEHGEKVVLLFQIGKFYEVYTIIEDANILIGNAEEISNILEIKLTKKDSTKEFGLSNPFFTGFPIFSGIKFINKLIKNDYIVIVYDQEETDDKENIKRYLKGIYTKTITPLDSEFEIEDNYLYVGIINKCQGKKDLYKYGYTIFNNKTNEVYVNELINVNIKEINQEKYNIQSMYNIQQKIERCSDEIDKKYKDREYCTLLIKEVYSHVQFGLLDPVQYLFNTTVTDELIHSLCLFFDLLNRYNSSLLVNISIPVFKKNKSDRLILHLNTKNQLHLKELREYVINCVTSIGKRKASSLLNEPYCDKQTIERMMKLSKQIESYYKDLINTLKDLKDVVKIHRELTTYSIKIENMYNKIVNNYIIIEKTIDLLPEECLVFEKVQKNELKIKIKEMIKDVIDNVNSEYFLDTSKWKTEELKELEKQIDTLNREFDEEKIKYEKYDKNGYLKLETGGIATTEFYYKITNARLNQNTHLKKAIEADGLIVVQQKTCLKIISTKLNEKWQIIEVLKNEITKKTSEIFRKYLEYYTEKYSYIFTLVKEFIEDVDIAIMNNINKDKYRYSPVEISKKYNLYVKDLRHPIIERINENVEYVANDVSFTDKNKGIILYGINSSGKSSLIRALGIAIIMGQSGFYVPCTRFEISELYKNLMCQVDLQDDIFKGNSSFITEAIGIKYMLKMLERKEKSLVIADELTRGTENKSAVAIFGATIKRLLSHRDCNFIFTTHLHEISELKTLKEEIDCENLRIFNIRVDRDERTGEFIFKRKLERGPINPLYGLEIVKSIIGDKIFDPFIYEAENIRREICGEHDELVLNNKSKYNKKKIVNKCEICGYKKVKKTDLPLDVHHIRFQCNADEGGFMKDVEYIHKNSKSNLITLCKQCHIKVHKNEITIDGYVQTTENTKIVFKNNS